MLELFEVGAPTPTRTVALEPDATSATPIRLWRTELAGLPERFEYLVRLDDAPPLLDPFAKLLTGGEQWGRSDSTVGPGWGEAYRGLVAPSSFDWQGVTRRRSTPRAA